MHRLILHRATTMKILPMKTIFEQNLETVAFITILNIFHYTKYVIGIHMHYNSLVGCQVLHMLNYSVMQFQGPSDAIVSFQLHSTWQ